jgi:hypothetical protein
LNANARAVNHPLMPIDRYVTNVPRNCAARIMRGDDEFQLAFEIP